MRLGCCLVASDLNSFYLDFYPQVNRVWRDLVGVPAKLALIAEDIPAPLKPLADDIILIEPIPGVHTAFQAQCIRLLLPALMEKEADGGAIVISDIDMLPMNKTYYTDTIAGFPDNRFIMFRRNATISYPQIAMCYNAATAATWSDIIGGIADLWDVRARLADWGAEYRHYDGHPAGRDWEADQRILFKAVQRWQDRGALERRLVMLNDSSTGFRRLDRDNIVRNGGLLPGEHDDIRQHRYSDYHMLRPFYDHQPINDKILALLSMDREGQT